MEKEIILHGNVVSYDDFDNPLTRQEDTIILGKELSVSIDEYSSIAQKYNTKRVIQLEVYKEEYQDQSSFTVDNKKYRVDRVKFSDVDNIMCLLVGVQV